MLRRLGNDQPFFLFVHYFDPHNTYRRHPSAGFAPPAVGRLNDRPSIRKLRAMLDELTEEEIAFVIDLYDDEIRFTDDAIGRLLAALRELGLDGETIVALTADHGEVFLERGWIGHTRSLHDELLRVPLIVRDTRGGNSSRVEAQPVSVASLAPTLLELAGFDPTPFGFQSTSLAGAVRGEPQRLPDVVYEDVAYLPTRRELPIKQTL